MGSMPELPEAETIARQLHRQLAGRRLGATQLARTDIVRSETANLAEVLAGRSVVAVLRRGKRVVIELEGEAMLVFGLGMTGRLTVSADNAEVENHTHLRVAVPEIAAELRFRDPRRFGGIWWYCGDPGSAASGDLLREYGVEPLRCTARQFREIMARRRQVKALLMDQRHVAGLGNIYCDESLHAARIHPQAVARCLSQEKVDGLLVAIKAVLRRAIRSKGSTLMDYRDADGSEGSFQRSHRVYGREGKPCKTCGTAIRRIVAAGRSTHFCPSCQRRKSKK